MKSIMSFTQDNQEILIYALVIFEETRDESNAGNPSFKVVSLNLKELTIIHLVKVVMGEVYTHIFIEVVYTT